MQSDGDLRSVVILPWQLAEDLLEQAGASPQEEICGFISGRERRLLRCYPVSNVATDKRCFFEMDPRGQLDAMRRIEERGEEWLAIYHSHVSGPAYPSATDLEWHAYPEALYVIISPTEQEDLRLRAFWIRAQQVSEVRLRIE